MEGTSEVEILKGLVDEKKPMVAIVAPSFPIQFEEKEIIGKLRKLGFSYVVEVATGAQRTNIQVLNALKSDERARFITGPCPSVVRLIRQKYPDLVPFLAERVDSPMVATARMMRESYPGYDVVFMGPCIAKKKEASEDHPELGIIVVTYKEMMEVFDVFGVVDGEGEEERWDMASAQTRLYPVSGGLAQSSGLREILADDEIEVVSGWKNCEEALVRFAQSDKVRLLDILFCEGGCVNGPGIVSDLSLEERRKRIVEYWDQGREKSI